MRTFKKVLISVLCLLCCIAILSTIIIAPLCIKEGAYYFDRTLRRDLAGSIDTIFLGASHALCAFKPEIIDETLGCNSYNLSAANLSANGKKHLLDKELARNPVKTVYLEVSYNTLVRNVMKEYGDGDTTTVARLDSVWEAFGYMFRYIKVENWMNIYSRFLVRGLAFWKTFPFKNAANAVDREAKGFWSKDPVDLTVTEEEREAIHCSVPLDIDFIGSEVDALLHQIESSHQAGAEVVVVVTPVSDRLLWQEYGWDDFRTKLETFSEENGCTFYDFNLLKDRYSLFHDNESFFELGHMSKVGADVFSRVFADFIKQVEAGEDVSGLFYDTYAEMLEDSPYMQASDS